MSQFRSGIFAVFLASATALAPASAFAETISGALAKAYQLNSELNSARAGVRVTDEGVAIAKSGYRPTINGSAAIDYNTTRTPSDSRPAHHRFDQRVFRRRNPADHFRRFSDQEQCRGGHGECARATGEPAQHRAEHPVRRSTVPIWTSSATVRSPCCASATWSSLRNRCVRRARVSMSARARAPMLPRPKPIARWRLRS